MKKLLILLLCISFSTMPAFCLISDDFVENSLDRNLKIQKRQTSIIVDDFVEKTLTKNVETIEKTTKKPNKKYSKNITPTLKTIGNTVGVNEIVPAIPKTKTFSKKIVAFDEKDFMPVKIRIKEGFSTKQKIDEGDLIEFETLEDIIIKNKNYPKGTTVKARIETISQNKSHGIPSDLTVGNFIMDDIPFQGEINKTGANRSLWVYPTMYAGSIFFGLGTFLAFIRGGHAKIKPDETFTVYLSRF